MSVAAATTHARRRLQVAGRVEDGEPRRLSLPPLVQPSRSVRSPLENLAKPRPKPPFDLTGNWFSATAASNGGSSGRTTLCCRS